MKNHEYWGKIHGWGDDEFIVIYQNVTRLVVL